MTMETMTALEKELATANNHNRPNLTHALLILYDK